MKRRRLVLVVLVLLGAGIPAASGLVLRFCYPEKYWRSRIEYYSRQGAELTQRDLWETEKIAHKQQELEKLSETVADRSPEYVRLLTAKRDLISILETINRQTKVRISRNQAALQQAGEALQTFRNSD